MITYAQLEESMPYATNHNISKFLRYLNEAMEMFNINTPKRIAMFIAQIAQESSSLEYVEEIASGKAYERRSDLGNLKKEALAAAHAKGKTTGRFYKGHGLIQITGYDNHKACGEALGIDAVNNPNILCDPKYAALSAGWFFEIKGCNSVADNGDVRLCTRIINGGYNGLNKRKQYYAKALSVMEAV